jgi:gluconolactonase
MRPANKCNGMTYDADLNLIVCEHATSSLMRERPDGRREVLASHVDGRELNSPNDVVVKSDGVDLLLRSLVWPHAGLSASSGRASSASRASIASPPGGGPPQLLVDRYLFDQPNGLCFSPDENRLFVNDTVQQQHPRLRRCCPNGRSDAGARLRLRHRLGQPSPACPTA